MAIKEALLAFLCTCNGVAVPKPNDAPPSPWTDRKATPPSPRPTVPKPHEQQFPQFDGRDGEDGQGCGEDGEDGENGIMQGGNGGNGADG